MPSSSAPLHRALLLRGVLAGALIALGLVGTLVSAWYFFVKPAPDLDRCLRIIATGRKDASAQAAQVFLYSVKVDNNPPTPLTSLTHDAGWQPAKVFARPALYAAGTGAPAQVTVCEVAAAAESVSLEFVSHPWSGIATVQWHDRSMDIDLYSPGGVQNRRIFVPQTAARLELSTVQLGLLASGSVIALATAIRWLLALLRA
jgi:hypothetical protein